MSFWVTVCKTVRPMLSDRCPICPIRPVCDVRVSWPNGWTDQDETWHAVRNRPWPHCVRWGPSFPPLKGGRSPIFGPSIVAKRLDGSRCHLVSRYYYYFFYPRYQGSREVWETINVSMLLLLLLLQATIALSAIVA